MTTPTQHTPGPWKQAANERIKGEGWMWIIDNAGRMVAKVNTIHPDMQRQAGDFEQESANARLIAAAPELLAALEVAELYLVKMVADDTQTAIPPANALRVVRAAIAEAKGL